MISRIEHDALGGLSVRSLTRVVEALDASAELVVRWHGEQLDRLIDADHARIVQGIVLLLESLEWMTRVEVSFNHYGDRGALCSAFACRSAVDGRSAHGAGVIRESAGFAGSHRS